MHDDVSGIDQHPVCRLEAFHLGVAMPFFLEGAQQVIGQCADMAVRTPAGDDHIIGDGRLAGQIYRDNVLGLVVVQGPDDQGFKGFTLLPAAFQAYRGGRSIIALAFDGQCRSSC